MARGRAEELCNSLDLLTIGSYKLKVLMNLPTITTRYLTSFFSHFAALIEEYTNLSAIAR